MRYFKLFIISVVVFSILLFCLSLVFPSTTYVSRAVNVKGERQAVFPLLHKMNMLAFHQKSSFAVSKPMILDVQVKRGQNADTILSDITYSNDIKAGLAFYQAGNDSTTVQVFYKIYAPWYKPWKKFALMLNESKYGPSLDSAIIRISRQF